MARVISIACQKGGVGKTTTALNLGISLNILGKKVLLIDLDPQGCLGIAFDMDQDSLSRGIFEMVVKTCEPKDVIHKTGIKSLHIIANNVWSNPAGEAIKKAMSNLQVLKKAVNSLRCDYDYILMDCPPSMFENTIAAIYSSDSVLIPVQSDYYVFMVLDQFLQTICTIKKSINRDLEIEGLLLTMFDGRLKSSREILKLSWERYGSLVFKTIIPRSTEIAQVIYSRKPISIYLPKPSRGALAYLSLARELIQKQQKDRR